MKNCLKPVTLLLACLLLFSSCSASHPEHTWGEWETVTPATCISAGEERRSCACGETETRVITDATAHEYDAESLCRFCKQSRASIRLSTMQLKYENEYGKLYFDEKTGTVGYHDLQTGQIAFTAPEADEVSAGDTAALSQLSLVWRRVLSENEDGSLVTEDITIRSADAWEGKQAVLSTAKLENGICVNYSPVLYTTVVPRVIERHAFEEKIIKPLEEAVAAGKLSLRSFAKFKAYYNAQFYMESEPERAEAIAGRYPITKEKNIDLYVLDAATHRRELWDDIQDVILTHCPAYTEEECRKDHAFVEYTYQGDTHYQTALNFTIDENGLTVDFAREYVNEAGESYPMWSYVQENGVIDETKEVLVGWAHFYVPDEYTFFAHLKAQNFSRINILV